MLCSPDAEGSGTPSPVAFLHSRSAVRYQRNQPAITAAVRGSVMVQYIQNLFETTPPGPLPPLASACQSNMLMLNRAATYVPGRNRALMNVKVIMAMLSFLLDSAIKVLSSLLFSESLFCSCAIRLYFCAMMLSFWEAAL